MRIKPLHKVIKKALLETKDKDYRKRQASGKRKKKKGLLGKDFQIKHLWSITHQIIADKIIEEVLERSSLVRQDF